MTLREGQLWFARAVMTGADDGHTHRRLTAGPRLDAAARLAIYQQGYEARLVECLADDYPVLAYALGDEAFRALCAAYVTRFPSGSPSLNAYGRHMPGFCEGFASDLARLEWAIVEVIHAASGQPLTLARLEAVPMERWAEARLKASDAVRLLHFAYPVNAYFQAERDGARPALPSAETSATVVYRSGTTVWRMALTPPMAALLTALVAGETLEQALSHVDENESPGRVMAWFREWVSSGLFVDVELP